MFSRHRPRHATIVAYVALFVALGGSSYAALKVTGKNVKDGSLTGLDIKNESLTGKDVRNGSLQSGDFAPGQLPAGAPGPKGDQGAKGDPGAKGDTGTVDTSNFYDKATSDGRFLGIGAQAVDSAALGGRSSSDYLLNQGSALGMVKGTAATTALGIAGEGELKESCGDPAQPSVSWHNTTPSSEHLMVDSGGSDATVVDSLDPDATGATVTGSTSPTVADHVTYMVSGTSLLWVDVFSSVSGNFCFVYVRAFGY